MKGVGVFGGAAKNQTAGNFPVIGRRRISRQQLSERAGAPGV
jgi:hypothetical protein